MLLMFILLILQALMSSLNINGPVRNEKEEYNCSLERRFLIGGKRIVLVYIEERLGQKLGDRWRKRCLEGSVGCCTIVRFFSMRRRRRL